MPAAKKKKPATRKPAADSAPEAEPPRIRDRIKELRRVKASDLIANERNWRKHPAAQVAALTGSLEEIGWADVAIAYEVDGELVLIDGHARAGIDPDAMVPVVILDVDEAEANKLLATLDPITAMATTDQTALDELIAGIECRSEDLGRMVQALAHKKSTPIEATPPAEFPSIDEDIDCDYRCPKCQYEWSGGTK